MYQKACGAAASAGGCVEADRECQGLISKEPIISVEHDYSGFDIVKATQVSHVYNNYITIALNCSMVLLQESKNLLMLDIM